MHLIRYRAEYQEPMLALHRSALEGFTLGMSQQQDEADLVAVEDVYLRSRGEFLLGLIGEPLPGSSGDFLLVQTDLTGPADRFH